MNSFECTKCKTEYSTENGARSCERAHLEPQSIACFWETARDGFPTQISLLVGGVVVEYRIDCDSFPRSATTFNEDC